MFKKLLLSALACMLCICILTDTARNVDAASITFTNKGVSELTSNNARINVQINSSSKITFSSSEFRIQKVNSSSDCPSFLNCSWYGDTNFKLTYKQINSSFSISQYAYSLEENSTYAYQYRVKAGGNFYYSSVYYFSTKPVVRVTASATNITKNNATLTASFDFGNDNTITRETGFWFGTSRNALTKCIRTDNGLCIKSSKISCSFDLNKYLGYELKPSTTYYYVCWAMTSTGTYSSEIRSFTTQNESIVFGSSSFNMINCYFRNSNAMFAVGKQEPLRCSIYALSYCLSLESGTTVNPYNYLSGGYAMWSWAGYHQYFADNISSLKNSILQQLDAGHPVILYCTGSYRSGWTAGGDHYVTVLGVKTTADRNNLKFSDFICIDPGDAGLFTLLDNNYCYSACKLVVKD